MDEFERRLRDSLQARADDVEPTPQLWQRVEGQMNRRNRLSLAAAALGTAAAVAAGVVVVTNVFDEPNVTVDQPPSPTPTQEPTPTPTSEPTTDPVPGDAAYVATDGTVIELVRSDGSATTLYEQDPEGEATITAVEVRPGSTVDDLTVVFLAQAEGMWDLRYLTYDGSEADWDYLPQNLQVSPDITPDAFPVPAFDPTGSHLAWVETLRGEDNQSPTLQTIGWTDDGPGTGETADDNAGWELEQISAEFPGGFQVEDWAWDPHDVPGQTKDGLIYLTGGATEAWTVAIEEQPDGGLAIGASPVSLVETPAAAVVDHGATADGAIYRLVVPSAGQGEVSWALRITAPQEGVATPEENEIDLPEGFPTQTNAPGDGWMTIHGDTVLVGFGQDAWQLFEDGWEALDGGYTYVDALG